MKLHEAGVSLIDCDHRTPPAAEAGFPYIAIPQLKAGRLDLSEVRRISPENFAEWTRKANPQADDVVLSRRCNPGETAVVPEGLECALGQNLVLLRADGKTVLPRFLRWAVRGPAWWDQVRKFINVGAVFDSLRCGDVPNLELPIPPLAEQAAIVRILGTLDDKIELNRRMNATLEAMARALFKSWFVDFDPVRAKAQGRKPAGLDPNTAKLFPKEFVSSALGEIPKGWTVRGLDEIADFRNGLALQRFRPGEGEPRLPVVKIAQLRTGQPDSGEWSTVDIDPSCILEDGDVVFSWSGSLAVVVWCGGRAALNQHLFRVTSKCTPKWFYLRWLLEHLPEFQRIAGDKATTMGHIQRHHLSGAKCAVPPRHLIEVGEPLLGPTLQRQIANNLEIRALAALRDTLLPKLLSGELRVGDAKRLVGAVA